MRQLVVVLVLAAISATSFADTVAYYRFEEGPADAVVPHPTGDGVFFAGTMDASGNGNHLSAWTEADWAGERYRTTIPSATVPLTGAANMFSLQNSGDAPGLFTSSVDSAPSGIDLQSITPTAWTIEASVLSHDTGGYHTILGRDGTGTVPGDTALAPLYFQTIPSGEIAIKFSDLDGNWHEALSGFSIAADTWYNIAAVSDGSTLSLYVDNMLVDSTDLGSGNTSLAKAGDDQSWSIFRGMHNGGHVDRWYGFMDEVRISDAALAPSEFLFVPEPGTLALLALGGLVLIRRR